MLIPVLLVVASLVVLYFGADFLVKGSSSLAVRFGISPLVVGLTVVAFGTSAPELLVSVQSALEGNPGIDSAGCTRDAGGHVIVRGDIS